MTVGTHDLRELAIDIAREAGGLAKRRRIAGVEFAATKSTLADIVTEADREVEELIRRRLRQERPEDAFLGEESGEQTGTSAFTWVVDPIDGTVNYAAGIPAYCVSIAVVDGRDPDTWHDVAGAVYAPVLDEMFSAARHEGAWLGNRRLAVSVMPSAGALLGTGFGYDPETHDADLATVRRVMSVARDVRRMGAAALDLAYVAAGRLDGYFERGLQLWDFAAGAMLVREAGGVCQRLDEPGVARRMTIAGDAALVERVRERVLAPQ